MATASVLYPKFPVPRQFILCPEKLHFESPFFGVEKSQILGGVAIFVDP